MPRHTVTLKHHLQNSAFPACPKSLVHSLWREDQKEGLASTGHCVKEGLGVTGVEQAELKQRYSAEVLAEGTKTIRGNMWFHKGILSFLFLLTI